MIRFLSLLLVVVSWNALGQQVTVDPIFPKANQPLTLTVDVSGTGLNNYAGDVYIWTWIPGNLGITPPTNVNPAANMSAALRATAKWTKLSANVYTITFTPTTFFNTSLSSFSGNQLGFLLKGNDWANGQTADLFVTFFQGYAVQFTQPTSSSFFVNNAEVIPITAHASESSTMVLKVGGSTVHTAPGATTFTVNHTVTETSGSVLVEVLGDADATADVADASFTYVIRSAPTIAPRPPGIVDGINYHTDQTKATLSLWAPGKTSVYIVGDFTGWEINGSYQMKHDGGEHFWLEVTGLTPGTEYAFKYLVNETLWLADPYADKILDPDDQYIPATTYPDLMPFPTQAVTDKWYHNRAAVLQTSQTPYPWVVTNFTKPPKENLVIYELLIRDFFGATERTYQNLIDTLTYLKRLGVNAIELMPITEFGGNESWGYNPQFMFAPDKSYGTKNKLKEFIDVCHQEGIAVILDMVMNHHDTPNPYVMMDFDFTAFKPTANNKWFNIDAKHPFNVFFDMNHESAYTKKYLDTVNHYWLNEYKFDGYRYDLSKGFTQTFNTDVGIWGLNDPSRIAILQRMADKIWEHTPDAYVILEHFADNAEETTLANYGMLLWSNHNYSYNQNTLGLSANSDFSWIYYETRLWTVPHSVGYMESHDEERMMFRNLQQGLALGSYNIKELSTSLERMKAAAALFYTIPGPKMLWQFEELGYDISIEQDGRVSPKPVKWEYLADVNRRKLNQVVESLIKLKTAYPIFSTNDVMFSGGNTLLKQIMLRAVPFTATPSGSHEMSAVIAANFDLSPKTMTVNFPHTGNWYHYFSGGDLTNITNTGTSMTLQPGEARIYTNVALPDPGSELVRNTRPIAPVLNSVIEGFNSLNLSWTDLSSIETGFRIYRRPAGGTFAVVGEVATNAQYFSSFGGLDPLTDYEFYVESYTPYAGSASNTFAVTTSDEIVGLEQEWMFVKVYPNPTSGQLTVELPAALSGSALRIYDMLGQPVHYRQVTGNTLDMGAAPPGIYVLSVASEYQTRSFKIVKQ